MTLHHSTKRPGSPTPQHLLHRKTSCPQTPMSCVISKANIQHYFVNVSVQRRKAVCVGCVVYLDVLVIGCIVYLAELVIIGLGIRLRQGFADRDCG